MSVYAAALFYILTPGVFVRFPAGASSSRIAMVHAAMFGVAWMLTHKLVWQMLGGLHLHHIHC